MDKDSISQGYMRVLEELELFDPLENGGLLLSFRDEAGSRVAFQLRDTAVRKLAEMLASYPNPAP
ncbi:hypothetical protein [Nitrosovibrio sp. Nv6]|uniref:hypothetical protein n=1 Tax=Nitrosovibrio sp. Nv6 TaxID=1855340 RepID=UPI00115F9750|nr:hypothetical protein [Nitrosovibrio sp. Nv6]